MRLKGPRDIQPNIRFAVCIFLTLQIWSHFQRTCNKFKKIIIEPNSMNVLCQKTECVPLIPSKKNESCRNWSLSSCYCLFQNAVIFMGIYQNIKYHENKSIICQRKILENHHTVSSKHCSISSHWQDVDGVLYLQWPFKQSPHLSLPTAE